MLLEGAYHTSRTSGVIALVSGRWDPDLEKPFVLSPRVKLCHRGNPPASGQLMVFPGLLGTPFSFELVPGFPQGQAQGLLYRLHSYICF